MSESIFRKKSIEKLQAPEDLNEYVRVANPGVWLLLASVIVILIGACVWGIFGHIDSTAPARVTVIDGSAVCYISDDSFTSVTEGMTVKFADSEAKIVAIGEKEEQGYKCTLEADKELADGVYDGKIVTESTKPISFILN